MYKDYKKTESLDTGLVGGNGLIWMFSGIVLGLFAGLGMYYFSNNPTSNVDAVQQSIKKAQHVNTARAPVPQRNYAKTKASRNSLSQNEERQTKFSYYAMLPKVDVPVDFDKPLHTGVDAIPNAAAVEKKAILLSGAVEEDISPQIRTGDYLLQVASFRKKSMANVTKGRLSKRGVDAYVQKKKIKGTYWYRVVAGPIDQLSVDSWKRTAEKLGHRPLVLSIR